MTQMLRMIAWPERASPVDLPDTRTARWLARLEDPDPYGGSGLEDDDHLGGPPRGVASEVEPSRPVTRMSSGHGQAMADTERLRGELEAPVRVRCRGSPFLFTSRRQRSVRASSKGNAAHLGAGQRPAVRRSNETYELKFTNRECASRRLVAQLHASGRT
jgi:hypothetical protein